MNKENSLIFYFPRFLDRLHNDEHLGYVEMVMNPIEARVLAIDDAELTAQWNDLQIHATMEDFLYNHPKSAEETPVIAGLNSKRTDILLYIFELLDLVIRRSPHAADVEKAKHLDYVLTPYKKAPGKSIAAKTVDIRNIVQDSKLEPNDTYADDLHLTETILLLETANNELDTKFQYRAKLWLEKEKYGTLTQLHPLVNEKMGRLADTLDFLYKLNERGAKNDALRAQLEGIAEDWNAASEQYVRVLAQRGTTVTLNKPSPVYPTPPANPEPPSPPAPPPVPDFE